MTYQETLDFMFSQLPMYQRQGSSAFKKDLTNTLALCKALGNPERKFKTIHVAGTNGKGSVSHMLAAILQKQGLKTGLYTSPHLKDFRERIRINGEICSEEYVVNFVEKNKNLFSEITPSFFEMTVSMCFDHFAEEQVDIAIIETGLGGRLDSTNVITPILSVITNIGYDHTDMLGHTLQEIAGEKAGIIKKNVPVVIGEMHQETTHVFVKKANEVNATIHFAEQGLEVEHINFAPNYLELSIIQSDSSRWFNDLRCDLSGGYQYHNILTVLKSVDLLKEQNYFITDETIKTALADVKGITGLQGRWQTIGENPAIICDTGHNAEGIRYNLDRIKLMEHDQLHMVFGSVADKDISKVLAMLPTDAIYYFCKADIPRGKDATILKSEAAAFHLKGETYSSVTEAFNAAKLAAEENDLIFVGGSTFVVAEVL